MNIVLTGAQGQVGFELARWLPELGTVHAVNREQLDLTDTAGLREYLWRHRPDVLVNAAAYTSVDQAESEPERAMAVNADAVDVMAQVMRELDGVMVHFSTDYVFDGRARQPINEHHPTAPLNHYGRSKRAGEVALERSGVPYLNFRTSWVYGARRHNFLRTVLRLAAAQEELRIVDDQFGAPTWCRHVALVCRDVLRHLVRSGEARVRWSGTYHLSAQGMTSWHGFACEILRQRNGGPMPARPRVTPIATEEFSTRAERPRFCVLSNSKLHHTFDIQPWSWTDQLSQCLADMRE